MLERLDIQHTGPKAVPTPEVPEGSSLRVTVRPLNTDLAAVTPTTMRYRIADLIQGAAVLDWTSLTPGTAVNVTVTAAQNALRNGLCRERRQLIVEASDADGTLRNTLDYDVMDIAGVTS